MSNLHKASIEEIKQVQWLQLKKQLAYLQLNSPFYTELLDHRNVNVQNIQSYEDFKKLPITTKEDLQQSNDRFYAVPRHEVIDYVTTSGTLGSPVSMGLNDADLERLTTNEFGSFKLAGVEKEDIVQITTTLDRRFMAGLAYFLGLRKLGAGIIRTGSGLPQLQWDSIERFKAKYLVAVPSFLLKMLLYAKENNIDFKNTSVKAAICIGEPIRGVDYSLNALGSRISELWDIELFSTYASTEMATAFTECEVHKGNHIQPELIFTEILDLEGNPVQPGEIGELVVTPLQSQTMPLLRFATGDMLTYTNAPCACGRNTERLSSVVGRKKQMIKLKGTSIYPQNVIEILTNFEGIETFVIEARRGELGTDLLTVKVADSFPLDRVKVLIEHFKSRLQVTPDLQLVKKEEIEILRIPEGSRKPQYFRDYR
ncbi:AMP-binding protein [Antarcticibacterium sp. 1MA-6-2]|uniref:phenylacetate--CoA ligase family protein n=1 Tax=Antarcticibacterium sp. 1MA-6-2 TaxID=2908210 RepID=UPI001F338518|nr:AMP-binding protein [Antarcticibacterium sp. 1MA-6-2]UJH91635.1 AMP-binding protein [Antarcticibacterium sp. 1MA-6-2]